MNPRSPGRWTRCGSRNITRYLKEGYKLQFITPARQLGRGTHAWCGCLPVCPPPRSAKRRTDLATGLHRAASEVWPTMR